MRKNFLLAGLILLFYSCTTNDTNHVAIEYAKQDLYLSEEDQTLFNNVTFKTLSYEEVYTILQNEPTPIIFGYDFHRASRDCKRGFGVCKVHIKGPGPGPTLPPNWPPVEPLPPGWPGPTPGGGGGFGTTRVIGQIKSDRIIFDHLIQDSQIELNNFPLEVAEMIIVVNKETYLLTAKDIPFNARLGDKGGYRIEFVKT